MISKVLTNKSTKNEGPFENMGLNGKTVWRFQKKKTETKISSFQKHAVEHTALKTKVFWHLLCKLQDHFCNT